VDASARWLRAHEPDPRGWYAGALGYCDGDGDGRFVVGIRAALLRGSRAWVYAGAGLVPGSDPAREWEETSVKMGLMRAVLGA
jgi:isochorismate synthase EntC